MNKMKKLFALLLAAAMLLSLAACGKGSDKPEATPTPEFVYASEFKTLSQGNGMDPASDFSARFIDETGFIGTMYEVVGQREPYEGEVAEYDGQFDILEPRLYHMDLNGKMTKLDYEPLRVTNEIDGSENSSWINSLVRTDEGFLAIEDIYTSWNDAPEGVVPYSDEWYGYSQSEERFYLRMLDAQGRELSCAEMDLSAILEQDGYFNPYRVALLPDGTVLTNGESALYVFDPADGSCLYSIKSDFEWIMNIFQLSDGQVYVAGYGETPNGYQAMLRPLDAEKRSFGEPLELDGDLYSAIPGDETYLLYYTNGNNFYGYDPEKQEAVKLFNWLNVDVLSDELYYYTVRDDGSIVGVLNEWDSKYENLTRTVVTIRQVPYASLPEKTVLTLATEYLDWNLRRELVRFNRASDSVRIEVLDYSEYDNYETDYDENGYGEGGGLNAKNDFKP